MGRCGFCRGKIGAGVAVIVVTDLYGKHRRVIACALCSDRYRGVC
jgi:hypothetical protein